MKEVRKINTKLENLKAQWTKEDEEATTTLERAKEAVTRIETQRAATTDVEEYTALANTLKIAKERCEFYELNAKRDNHHLSDTEMKNYLTIIQDHRTDVQAKHLEAIRQAYKTLDDLITEYESDMNEISDVSDKVRAMAGKAKKKEKVDYMRELAPTANSKPSKDPFVRRFEMFCYKYSTIPQILGVHPLGSKTYL